MVNNEDRELDFVHLFYTDYARFKLQVLKDLHEVIDESIDVLETVMMLCGSRNTEPLNEEGLEIMAQTSTKALGRAYTARGNLYQLRLVEDPEWANRPLSGG